MSLMRRNIIAWCLILAAGLFWNFGNRLLEFSYFLPAETTAPTATIATTLYPSQEPTTWPTATTVITTAPTPDSTTVDASVENTTEPGTMSYENYEEQRRQQDRSGKNRRFLGYTLCIATVVTGFWAVFILRQKNPVAGPDCVLLLCAIAYLYTVGNGAWKSVLPCWVLLFSLREIWGWIRSRFPLRWCAMLRVADRCPLPQLSILVLMAVAMLPVAVWSCYYTEYTLMGRLGNSAIMRTATIAFDMLLLEVLAVCCICRYGADLHHLKKQLTRFREGAEITVGTGSFAADEALLLKIKNEHEQAVQTAVTSERFKVELISNVSHDLRTPLTSILGYGELLEKEVLTVAGKEQLARLNQKAGYMRDLVDSLFELTKVSSGVLESKKEQIDLIRLLEQTAGLFDDQLTAAGLEVRRHYCSESVAVSTDGARMHQVFANLLGNAIKYALKGTRIHLEVKENNDHYSVRMVNTASYEMDFDPEQILQRFARGDKARSGQGSGLGLAIAQTYTESVGGSFHVAVDGDQFSAIVLLPKN